MDASIIYFDNAATTFPKPEEVYKALDRQFRHAGSSGRGAHTLALESARAIFDSRELIADFLGCGKSERLIFTPGCTYSINVVLNGMVNRLRLKKDSVVLISALEHNAVIRPLHQLQKRVGFKIQALPYRAGAFGDLRDLAQALDEYKPALVILTEGSNVTGEILDWFVAADLCKQHAVPLLIDAAQTAGRFHGCLAHDGITFWCASAHKGLMGPQGLGLLYVHPDFDLEPLVSGGTGSASEQFDMPDVYPDHLEVGTMPSSLIVGLRAGIDWINKIGTGKIQEHENMLTERFLKWCADQPFIRLYGFHRANPKARIDFNVAIDAIPTRLPIVSFRLAGKSPDEAADLLQQKANIAVRSGLHCAALAHQALGSESTGLVRVSFGIFNTVHEVDVLCRTLDQIIGSR